MPVAIRASSRNPEEHTSRFGRQSGDLGPVYGYLWRSFGGQYPARNGIDQIETHLFKSERPGGSGARVPLRGPEMTRRVSQEALRLAILEHPRS